MTGNVKTNGDKFEEVFGVGQANLAIASCSWWDEEYVGNREALSESSKMLIENCPHLINMMAEKLNSMIDNWGDDAPLEPVEINHVGYSPSECGYDK